MKLKTKESQNIEFKQIWKDEYIKWISAFGNSDLVYQDVIEGNLFEQVDKTIELIFTKYLKAIITYEGIQRVESFPIFLAGYIESWGRGIEKIVGESQKFNGITPQFRWLNGLWVEFYFNKVVDKDLDKVGDRLGDRLGDTQQNIINLVQYNPKISITQLSSKLGISTTAIEKHTKKLKEQNILKRVGSAKGGYWEILK